MIFKVKKLTRLFSNSPHMSLTVHTHYRIPQEGLVKVDDFEHFNGDHLDMAIKNLWMSIPIITYKVDANGVVLVPGVSPIFSCDVSAKVQSKTFSIIVSLPLLHIRRSRVNLIQYE